MKRRLTTPLLQLKTSSLWIIPSPTIWDILAPQRSQLWPCCRAGQDNHWVCEAWERPGLWPPGLWLASSTVCRRLHSRFIGTGRIALNSPVCHLSALALYMKYGSATSAENDHVHHKLARGRRALLYLVAHVLASQESA